MSSTDYLAIARCFAPTGCGDDVIILVARGLHYSESLHLHNLGQEREQHGACSYCLLRAARAIRELDSLPYDEAERKRLVAEVRP